MVTELLRKIKDNLDAAADAVEKGGDYDAPADRVMEGYNELNRQTSPMDFLQKPDGSKIPLTPENEKKLITADVEYKIIRVQPDLPLKQRMALHSIKNSLQEAYGITVKDLRDIHGIKTDEAKRVSSNISKLLERLDDPVHFEKTDIRDIIAERKRDEREIDVHFDPDTVQHAVVDRYLFKGLVNNLFNNSKQNLKESDVKEKRIMVTLRDMGEHIKLIHEDTGTGFPEGFDPHDPVTTRKAEGGTGQGVREVMDVAREHGMQVKWENRPEGGARVTVRMPKKPKRLIPKPKRPI